MNNSDRLLQAMNGIDSQTLEETRRLLEQREERSMPRKKKLWRTILIAAVITSLLSVTAYAVSQFTMQGRPGTEGECFVATFDDQRIEWRGEYVFSFEGPSECRRAQFHVGWAPSEDYWDETWSWPNEDGYNELMEAYPITFEDENVRAPRCVIDVMYAPQFIDGGAMILMGFKPGEITEEQWGEVKVYRFSARATHAIDAEQTVYKTGNFVILFHPEQGWIVGVRGYDTMENIEGIARSIEVRQLDEIIRREDFESNVQFCDIYMG